MENSNKLQVSASDIENDKSKEFLTNKDNVSNETKLINEFVTPNQSKDDSSKLDTSKFIQHEIEHVTNGDKDTIEEEIEMITDNNEGIKENKKENLLQKDDSRINEATTPSSGESDEKKEEGKDNNESKITSKNEDKNTEKDGKVIEKKEHESSEENPDENEQEKDKTEDKSNKSDEWEDILGSGSLLKKKISSGAENSRPKRLDVCTIRYKCTLEDGTLVEEEDYATIQLGDLEVVQGVDLALALMDIGEKCLLRIEPRLAFGSIGLDNRVPPDAPVLYELELIFAKPEPDMATLNIPERKSLGEKKKKRGNWWYARGENALAIQCYRRALDFLDEVEGGISDPLPDNDDPVQRELTDAALQSLMEDRINVSNNMAQAQLKMGAYDAALQSLQTVLRCQPNNIKALFRKSKILRDKNEIQQALACLNKARHIEPQNATILKEIQEINAILKKHKNHEKELARRMFGGKESKQPKDSSSNMGKTYMWATVVLSVAAGIAGVVAWRFKFT